jgi:hypothetical protein
VGSVTQLRIWKTRNTDLNREEMPGMGLLPSTPRNAQEVTCDGRARSQRPSRAGLLGYDIVGFDNNAAGAPRSVCIFMRTLATAPSQVCVLFRDKKMNRIPRQ